ncbi:hypothetical protein FN846DRAFT_960581 [Sphaerosporella brunnea]|uniref:Uncharacterized protein n=1 Tax=Sphaerosporella brunnea TaxID=1250544 RepID=A0A5J5EQL3_9PEZI|nr:hypothetical protein FN846DRAFT_960581 [Sphaerosporella brunnea]
MTSQSLDSPQEDPALEFIHPIPCIRSSELPHNMLPTILLLCLGISMVSGTLLHISAKDGRDVSERCFFFKGIAAIPRLADSHETHLPAKQHPTESTNHSCSVPLRRKSQQPSNPSATKPLSNHHHSPAMIQTPITTTLSFFLATSSTPTPITIQSRGFNP